MSAGWAQEKVGKGGEQAPKAQPAKEFNAYREMARANKLANAGGYTRAVALYEQVVRFDPDGYAVAHFNMGEIYKIRNKFPLAAFHYQAYLSTGRDEDTLKQARAGLRQCLLPSAGTLSVGIAQAAGEIWINGFLFARSNELAPIQLPAGKYTVTAKAQDHGDQTREVEIKDGSAQRLDFTLEQFTFYGQLKVDVDHADATITISPRALDKADETAQQVEVRSPMQPVTLATGKYFIEIKREGFNPWIRNVQVTRDGTTLVEAKLTRALPPEIR
jgi:tetratricopeptide (TPR) repeat protein